MDSSTRTASMDQDGALNDIKKDIKRIRITLFYLGVYREAVCLQIENPVYHTCPP